MCGQEAVEISFLCQAKKIFAHSFIKPTTSRLAEIRTKSLFVSFFFFNLVISLDIKELSRKTWRSRCQMWQSKDEKGSDTEEVKQRQDYIQSREARASGLTLGR